MDVPSSGAGAEPEADPSVAGTPIPGYGPGEDGAGAVARAGLLMVTMALVSRLLGMGREMAIAAQLGQSWWADVYVAAFRVPDLLFVLLSSGALASVFVPVFTQYLEAGDRDRAWRFFSNACTIVGLAISVFVILAEVFVKPLTGLVNPGFLADPAKLEMTARLTRIVLPAQLFFFVGSVLISVQYAFRRFLIPSLATVVYNLCIIAGGLAFSYPNTLTRALGLSDGLGPAGFSWGALIGAFLGNIALQAAGVARIGGRYTPILDLRDEGVRKFGRLMVPIIFTLSLPQLDTQVNQFFASYLKAGSMASLNYANRLMQMPLGILAQASAIVIFPYIAAQAARNDMTGMRRSLNLGIRSIIAMTAPAATLMMVLAEPVVRLVYQRHEFTAADTLLTAPVLVFYAAGIAAWSASTVLARGFYALQDTATPMITGTVVTVLLVALDAVLVGLMGTRGLALATSIAATVFAAALFIRLNRRVGGLNGALVVRSGLLVALACGLTAAPVYGLRRLLTPLLASWGMLNDAVQGVPASHHVTSTTDLSTGGALVLVVVCAVVGAVIYGGLLGLLRVEEARFAWDRLTGRLRRRPHA